jgi:hypothetical protein
MSGEFGPPSYIASVRATADHGRQLFLEYRNGLAVTVYRDEPFEIDPRQTSLFAVRIAFGIRRPEPINRCADPAPALITSQPVPTAQSGSCTNRYQP